MQKWYMALISVTVVEKAPIERNMAVGPLALVQCE